MSQRRDVRRLAMQVLYQMDMTGTDEAKSIGANLDDFDAPEICAEAVELAEAAWPDREQADRMATDLAPKWPTHRQPPVDRSILRLAYHEMASGRTPVKVAINEAVELAKVFGTRESAPFINGVLDKMAKRMGRAMEESYPARVRTGSATKRSRPCLNGEGVGESVISDQ